MKQPNNLLEIINQLNTYGLLIKNNSSYTDMMNAVADHINHLIVNDFATLINLLYRLDVNEADVRKLLKEQTGELASNSIAKLIIERQQRKIELRASFKRDENIPDDEKW